MCNKHPPPFDIRIFYKQTKNLSKVGWKKPVVILIKLLKQLLQ